MISIEQFVGLITLAVIVGGGVAIVSVIRSTYWPTQIPDVVGETETESAPLRAFGRLVAHPDRSNVWVREQ